MKEASAAKAGQSKTTTFTWSNTGTCSSQTAERCLVTVASGFLLSTDPSSTTYTTTSKFDANHRLTTVLGPKTNQQTVNSYNANAATNDGGRRSLTQIFTSATAHLDTTFASYDLYGTPGTVTDPNAVQTTNTTDERGRVTIVVSKKPASDPNEPPDYTTTYTYDKRDRLTSILLPAGNKISYTYEDGTNRLLNTIQVDSAGLQQARLHLTLNLIGGKTKEEAQVCTIPAATCVAANWVTKRTESFKYDAHNRLSEITHPTPTGSKIVYTYDTRGNLKTVKDETRTAANTTYAYDGLSRLTSVTQTLTVIDPNTNLTTYA
jgi:YD repeat-containing protein